MKRVLRGIFVAGMAALSGPVFGADDSVQVIELAPQEGVIQYSDTEVRWVRKEVQAQVTRPAVPDVCGDCGQSRATITEQCEHKPKEVFCGTEHEHRTTVHRQPITYLKDRILHRHHVVELDERWVTNYGETEDLRVAQPTGRAGFCCSAPVSARLTRSGCGVEINVGESLSPAISRPAFSRAEPMLISPNAEVCEHPPVRMAPMDDLRARMLQTAAEVGNDHEEYLSGDQRYIHISHRQFRSQHEALAACYEKWFPAGPSRRLTSKLLPRRGAEVFERLGGPMDAKCFADGPDFAEATNNSFRPYRYIAYAESVVFQHDALGIRGMDSRIIVDPRPVRYGVVVERPVVIDGPLDR